MSGEPHKLVSRVSALLHEEDPLHVVLDNNPDEYEPEARALVRRREEAVDETASAQILWEVLRDQFGSDAIASVEAYRPLASKLYLVLNQVE